MNITELFKDKKVRIRYIGGNGSGIFHSIEYFDDIFIKAILKEPIKKTLLSNPEFPYDSPKIVIDYLDRVYLIRINQIQEISEYLRPKPTEPSRS